MEMHSVMPGNDFIDSFFEIDKTIEQLRKEQSMGVRLDPEQEITKEKSKTMLKTTLGLFLGILIPVFLMFIGHLTYNIIRLINHQPTEENISFAPTTIGTAIFIVTCLFLYYALIPGIQIIFEMSYILGDEATITIQKKFFKIQGSKSSDNELSGALSEPDTTSRELLRPTPSSGRIIKK